MLGIFLRELGRGEVRQAHPRELQPGQVVLALAEEKTLREFGLPVDMQFGITGENEKVLCQIGTGKNLEAASFSIQEVSMETFIRGHTALLVPDIEGYTDSTQVYRRAKSRLGECPPGLRSFPGDDFVAECVRGLSMEELMEDEWHQAGRHWVTKLELTPSEIMAWLGCPMGKAESDVLDSFSVLKMLLPDMTHHGIVVEGNEVIHFSSCRLKDGTSRIKCDSLEDFIKWSGKKSDGALDGAPAAYRCESTEIRLLCRNRAVWSFFHANERGDYDLLFNNCEHFCRFCRTGKSESGQLLAKILQLIGFMLGWVPNRYAQRLRLMLARAAEKQYSSNRVPQILSEIDNLLTLKPEF